jgi:RNA-binding protein Tab2/Atab2
LKPGCSPYLGLLILNFVGVARWKRNFELLMSLIIWQADFYRSPHRDASGQSLWELLICDATRSFKYTATCPQSAANSSWVAAQIELAGGEYLPDKIQVFRPQAFSLIAAAGRVLDIDVDPTRHTLALKQWLQEKQYDLALDKPPPVPLPENLWGKEWRFATLQASDVTDVLAQRPIPILSVPEYLKPINLGLASTVAVPGIVIYGGRRSLPLAKWLEKARPVALKYVAGAPDGLVLEASLVDRWIVVTFADSEVTAAAKVYEQRKQQSRGLHFLLVQPDDSGMTYTGFWLLQAED